MRGVSSFTLKVVAIVGMTFNHACYIFYPYLPAEALLLLFGFGGLEITADGLVQRPSVLPPQWKNLRIKINGKIYQATSQ